MKKSLIGAIVAVVAIIVLVFVGIKVFKPQTNDNVNDTKKESSKKYDDLTITKRIGSFDDLWIDLPSWREDGSEDCSVAEYLNYYIIAVTSDECDNFEDLFNNAGKPNLRHFVDRGNYEDFVPETEEEVTLENGIKATKFEGTLHLEDYGDSYEYPTYGYYLKFNDKPVMVMSVETDTGSVNNSEEKRLTTNEYVDKVVQTIRSEN